MTVSEQIIQVINTLCEKFGMAIDWTSENVIPYVMTLCGKLITYEIWTSVAWIVLMLVLCLIAVIATKKLHPTFKAGVERDKKNPYDVGGWEIGSIFAIVGLIALGLVSTIVIVCQVADIIKCLTFPELYVFEYIQGLIG